MPTAQNSSWRVSGNDTDGGRNYMHWYSDGGKDANKAAHKNGARAVAARRGLRRGFDAGFDAGSDDRAAARRGRSAAGTARPSGSARGISTRATLTFQMPDIDFDSGDVIVFRKFGSDVFHDQRGGNTLSTWDDGGSVRINSAADLQELVQESPDVAAVVRGDDLILEIDHKHGGSAEVVFAGLGDLF